MWPFKNLRIFEIPDSEVSVLCRLNDTYYETPSYADHVAKYNLWKRIEKIFPETHEGVWGLEFMGTRIFVKELK